MRKWLKTTTTFVVIILGCLFMVHFASAEPLPPRFSSVQTPTTSTTTLISGYTDPPQAFATVTIFLNGMLMGEFGTDASGQFDITIDDDRDGLTDEDPLNGFDDDHDGLRDEDPAGIFLYEGENVIEGIVTDSEGVSSARGCDPATPYYIAEINACIIVRDTTPPHFSVTYYSDPEMTVPLPVINGETGLQMAGPGTIYLLIESNEPLASGPPTPELYIDQQGTIDLFYVVPDPIGDSFTEFKASYTVESESAPEYVDGIATVRLSGVDIVGNENYDWTIADSGGYLLIETSPLFPPHDVNDGPGADIDFSSSMTSLSANWSEASDSAHAIVAYWYAVGTSPGDDDVVGWTNAGLETSMTVTGLALDENTTYYIAVKAENSAGQFSVDATSDGVSTCDDTTAPLEPEKPNPISSSSADWGLHITFRFRENDPLATENEDISSYIVYRDSSPLGDFSDVAAVLDKNSLNYCDRANVPPCYCREIDPYYACFLDTEVELDHRYFYKMTAVDYNGNESKMSKWVSAMASMQPVSLEEVNDGITTDIDLQKSTTQLSANWSVVEQLAPYLSSYRYAIGRYTDSDVVYWKDAGTATSVTEINLSLEVGATYYFTVITLNTEGYESNPLRSDGVTITGRTDTALTINAGWTQIGISRQDVSINTASIFGDSKFEIIGYDSEYDYLTTTGIIDLDHAAGYWIYSEEQIGQVSLLSGDAYTADSFTIDLNEGWNVFANPYDQDIPWAADNAELTCGALPTIYNSYDNVYTAIAPNAGNNLEPWTGYWIHITGACTLTIRK